jgi:FKBP-type peptidyl-prolyl cis-trans isomerase
MKGLFVFLAIPALFTLVVLPALSEEQATEAESSMTPAQELSYVFGMDVGKSLKRFDAEVDLDIFMEAVRTTLKGGDPKLTPERAAEVQQNFLQQRREKLAAKRKAARDTNAAEGEAFLAENKTKEGVITTDSGLQCKVIKHGGGAKPQASDHVTVHYRGTLLDGTEFDSSYARGEPATFPVKGVIAGWTEALQLMPEGSTYKIFIPSKLAYGESGAGGKIGPNSTLIFEVELLKVVSAESKQSENVTQDAPAETQQEQEASKASEK